VKAPFRCGETLRFAIKVPRIGADVVNVDALVLALQMTNAATRTRRAALAAGGSTETARELTDGGTTDVVQLFAGFFVDGRGVC
jgi:hypothetical protein